MDVTYKLAVLAIRIVEFMFFAGVIGCSVAVLFSWVSILKDGLSKEGER